MFCYKCGAEINDNAKFCYSCGASQILEDEPVKMRPVKKSDGSASEYQRQVNKSEGPASGYRGPENGNSGPSDKHPGPGNSDTKKRNIAIIIIILAIAVAAVAVFMLFFKDRIDLTSGRTSEIAVSDTNGEDGLNGGSVDGSVETAAADSRSDSSETEQASAETASANSLSTEKDAEQVSASSSEDSGDKKTSDAGSSERSASQDKSAAENKTAAENKAASENKTAEEDKSASENKAASENKTAAENKAAAEDKTSSENKASSENKTASDNKAAAENKTAAQDRSAADERSARDQDAENKASGSGRPKTTGNNTDQMKLPESKPSSGTAQADADTVSPADTAVASVVMASTVSTSGYNKIVVQNIKASSALYQPGYDNSARSAVDNDVITSWQDGVDGYGEGQVIDMWLDKEYQIHCIHFNLGNWRDQQMYNENSRPKQITLYLGPTRSYTVIFPDGMNQYSVLLSADVPASYIRVQIDSVYPGALYDDTCISEISIYSSN